MNAEQRMVTEFHQRIGLPAGDHPALPGNDLHRARSALIEEELAEFRNAGEAHNLLEIADALGDLLYAVYGAAVSYGIDLEPVFKEIHRSNMTKQSDGSAGCRLDGKVGKGRSYQAPRLETVIAAQTKVAMKEPVLPAAIVSS
jgi:predicted HAD superfamily Cof-like phosphohydrolase